MRTEGTRTTTSGRATIVALGVAVVAFAVQQTAIVPAVRDVRESLGGSQEWASWLVTVYLIVATVATMAMGRLGDLHGRRRLLLIGLGVFALASVAAACAPSMPFLIVCRAVQGVGGAVYPMTLALAREHSERSTTTISLLAGAFGFGTALGLAGGGALAEYVSWRAIFGVGAALVLVATWLVWRTLTETTDRARGGFDVGGTVLLAVSAMTLLGGLTLVVSLGATSPVTIGLLVVAVGTALLWVRHERRTEHPLVDLGVLRNRRVAVVNAGTVGLGWTLFGSMLLVPEFTRAVPAQDGYGLGAQSAAVGLLMLPMAVGQTVSGPASGVLGRWTSGRFTCAAGLVVVAGGMALLALAAGPVLVLCGTALLGVGAGAALQAGSAVATEAVEPDVAAVSASVNSTVRRLAGGVGGQVDTILLTAVAGVAGFVVAYVVAGGMCLLATALLLGGTRRG